jgi:hypothetical protein
MNTATTFEREKYFTRLIWFFPLVYALHITEESHGFTEWVNNVLGGHMTMRPFLINNAVFMSINLSCCAWANRAQTRRATFVLFLWMSAQEYWNFVSHIYAEFRFNAYSPGYFTAIFLYLPTFCYLSYVALRERYIGWKAWLLAFALGPVFLGLTIWGGLYHFNPFPWAQWF